MGTGVRGYAWVRGYEHTIVELIGIPRGNGDVIVIWIYFFLGDRC